MDLLFLPWMQAIEVAEESGTLEEIDLFHLLDGKSNALGNRFSAHGQQLLVEGWLGMDTLNEIRSMRKTCSLPVERQPRV
jgi:hypothetical protein